MIIPKYHKKKEKEKWDVRHLLARSEHDLQMDPTSEAQCGVALHR